MLKRGQLNAKLWYAISIKINAGTFKGSGNASDMNLKVIMRNSLDDTTQDTILQSQTIWKASWCLLKENQLQTLM